jgi:DNA-binding transcriptional MocR family regulator
LPPEEPWFRHPCGKDYLLLRALTLDNWLTWGDALPSNPQSWPLLESGHAEWIEALARLLDRTLLFARPAAARLGYSPFRVDRWFDPHDPGTVWSEGRICRFAVDEVSPPEFVQAGHKAVSPRHMNICVDSAGWIQAEVTAMPPPPKPKKAAQPSRRSGRK